MATIQDQAAQIKSQYPGYVGWNDPYAIVGDFNATGGQGKGGPSQSTSSGGGQSSSVSSAIANAEAFKNFNIQANQPAISAYEASKQPLKDRYSAVLDEMKATKEQDVTGQTKVTNAELARRGVQGNLAEQTIQSAISPINQLYTSKIGQVGAAEGSDLAEIDKAIALLMSGNPQDAITAALQIQSMENQASQSNKPTTETVTAGGHVWSITRDVNGNIISKQDLGASSAGTGSSGVDIEKIIQDALNAQGGGAVDLNKPHLFNPKSGEEFEYSGGVNDPEYQRDIKQGFKLAPGYY